MSCPQSIVLGVRWVGQVVYRRVAWLLFKGCVVLKGPAGSGQLGSWAGEVHPTQLERENLSAPRLLDGPGGWSSH